MQNLLRKKQAPAPSAEMVADHFKPPAPLQTAVLFLVFNRPETTSQVFEAIRKAKPPRLYVAADGPRSIREGEAEKIAKVREIATDIDWPCEVKTLFRDENLGCKYAVSGGITWFFEHEEQGIILEDDCLPSQSFFWFCEELLNHYRDNERIFIITGYNKEHEWNPIRYDYFFSNLGGIWGWASWRRAWKHYDIEMNGLEELVDQGFFEALLGKKLGKARQAQLLHAKKKIVSGALQTWDYQWGYTRHKHRAIACVPSISLISNIGFDADATHTFSSSPDAVVHREISVPCRFNNDLNPDSQYDLKYLGLDSANWINNALFRWRR